MTILARGSLTSFSHQRDKKYRHGESYFGQTAFGFHAPADAFYRQYKLAFFIEVLGVAVVVTAVFYNAVVGGPVAMIKAGPAKFIVTFFLIFVWMFMLQK